ncbi:MAG: MBL fold metallo-hydrolase [Ornithinimicrobium sp.]
MVHTVPAAAFGTNCYILSRAEGEECVIVDPGIGVADAVADRVRRHGLSPAAILLTHGHLDHVYDVPALTRDGQPRTHIHPLDRYRLINPLGDLDRSFIAMMEAQFGTAATWQEPHAVVEFADAEPATPDAGTGSLAGDPRLATVQVAGLSIGVTHAPGHTEGSVLFTIGSVPDGLSEQGHGFDGAGVDRTVLSGDVLFAGSIGRTDLPGGDAALMARSLRDVVLPLPDSSLVLPGHGPATTMAAERRSNPYLQRPLV